MPAAQHGIAMFVSPARRTRPRGSPGWPQAAGARRSSPREPIRSPSPQLAPPSPVVAAADRRVGSEEVCGGSTRGGWSTSEADTGAPQNRSGSVGWLEIERPARFGSGHPHLTPIHHPGSPHHGRGRKTPLGIADLEQRRFCVELACRPCRGMHPRHVVTRLRRRRPARTGQAAVDSALVIPADAAPLRLDLPVVLCSIWASACWSRGVPHAASGLGRTRLAVYALLHLRHCLDSGHRHRDRAAQRADLRSPRPPVRRSRRCCSSRWCTGRRALWRLYPPWHALRARSRWTRASASLTTARCTRTSGARARHVQGNCSFAEGLVGDLKLFALVAISAPSTRRHPPPPLGRGRRRRRAGRPSVGSRYASWRRVPCSAAAARHRGAAARRRGRRRRRAQGGEHRG